MRKPAMDGKFPTAVRLHTNLARGRPFSRLSFAAMRLFDENLFQITGRRCFCPPSTQSADRRVVFIGKGKAGFPLVRHFGNRPNRLAGRTPLPQKRRQVLRFVRFGRFGRSRYLHSPFFPVYPDFRRPKKQTAAVRSRKSGRAAARGKSGRHSASTAVASRKPGQSRARCGGSGASARG